MLRTALLVTALVAMSASTVEAKPTVVKCKFEHLPPMVLTYQPGVGDNGSTVKIGKSAPVRLSVGSNLSTAHYGAQELTFSIRLPSSVTISAPDQDRMTYTGECVSNLRH